MITTRDGDNKTIVLAWSICETESSDTYEYFTTKCHKTGLSRYLSAAGVIFSDRQKDIKSFHVKFTSKIGRCFHHIIGNCQKRLHGSGQSFVEARRDAPYGLNAKILKWIDVQLEIRRKSITKWIEADHPITKYAMRLFEVQVGPTHIGPTHTHFGPNTMGPLTHSFGPTLIWAQTCITHHIHLPDLWAHVRRLPWLNVQAKKLCQAALESTTLRTFEEPMAGHMKSCWTTSVASILSCISNLADTWFACSTRKACWGTRSAAQIRQFAGTGQDAFTVTTI